MSYSYVFTALRGKQASRDYFIAMCPLKLVPKVFLFDEAELRPEIRAQRLINRTRVPEIANYLNENHKDYVLSSLTASIDGEVEFVPFGGANSQDAGILTVPMTARFLINDGQHRRAGIEEALKLRPELGDETISVVFFLDSGLRRSQQMFADLNRHAVRPTLSIGVLYDHRDPLSQLARDVIERVSVFRGMVEKEKTSISNRSAKMFTLSGVYHSNKILLSKKDGEQYTKSDLSRACEFWELVAETIPEWSLAQQRKIAAASLREETVHAHGLALHALAIAGADLIAKYPADWKNKLKKLQKIDWSRSNTELWEGVALVDGRVSKAQTNVKRTANYIRLVLGLPTMDEEVSVGKLNRAKPVFRMNKGRKINSINA
jgi:DNA sulfur modification protein DndB